MLKLCPKSARSTVISLDKDAKRLTKKSAKPSNFDLYLLKGYSKKTSFFKIGGAMFIQMAKSQLFLNP